MGRFFYDTIKLGLILYLFRLQAIDKPCDTAAWDDALFV